jgi:hypothetical protein
LENGPDDIVAALKANIVAFHAATEKAKERRNYPRVMLTVPVEFQIMNCGTEDFCLQFSSMKNRRLSDSNLTSCYRYSRKIGPVAILPAWSGRRIPYGVQGRMRSRGVFKSFK